MQITSVSVIVPIYNVEPYVEDCIRSVMRQTYEGPLECIVVDDCGTDDSMAIVEKVVEDYNGPVTFKILHHTHNRGLSAARNTGMDAATGDYLFFLDSDDQLTDDCIEKLTKPLEIELHDVVVGNVRNLNNTAQRNSGHQSIKLQDKTLIKPPMILRTLKNGWGVVAWNRLYRKDFIVENSLIFHEGLLYEDNLWSFQVACLTSSLYIVNHITYLAYNNRRNSITQSTGKEVKVMSYITIIKDMNSFIRQQNITDVDVFRIYNSLFSFVLRYYSDSLSNYVSIYKSIRPYIYAPIKAIIHKNHYHIKRCLHDSHYVMPLFVAPYWQYFLFYRFRYFLFQHKLPRWKK